MSDSALIPLTNIPSKDSGGSIFPNFAVDLPVPPVTVRVPVAPDVNLTFNAGRSADWDVEIAALALFSYGRQLGRIGDALSVLLYHINLEGLSEGEKEVIADFQAMLRQIDKVKKTYRRKED